MGSIKNKWKRRLLFFIALLAVVFGISIAYAFYLKNSIFDLPTSTVILDSDGRLLGAMIASDGQWRFPPADSLPEKYKECVLLFEDEHFYSHPGFNPLALARALQQNIKSGEVVSGGSTISMQVMRLAGDGGSRSYFRKLKEIFQSILLELVTSKEDIFCLYASNAPFGGNVVGIDAASWRYFNRDKFEMSWAESALLAVLPNSPSLMHPGRNRDELREKRDRLLLKLLEKEIIDSTTFILAKLEEIPLKPAPLPQLSPHLLSRAYVEHKGEMSITTIDQSLQQQVNRIVEKHMRALEANEIYNAAVIVAEVESGDVLAYLGNNMDNFRGSHQNFVDVAIAPRSTGSILKPVLYALMMEDGSILPNTLVPDVPTFIAGYTPKNFSRSYDGAVPAKRALSRSLNIPAVRMLRHYGYPRFTQMLRDLDLRHVSRPADDYGLSIILGGAEASLWDLCGMYAGLSRILKHFYEYSGRYDRGDLHRLNYIAREKDEQTVKELTEEAEIVSAASIYLTYEALLEVNRPLEEANYELFRSSEKIAWKTGTSFGFKDAWAIGTTPSYVVGVWVGNADGEGRPGLVGVEAAAPILFEIFRLLPNTDWFDAPYDELVKIAVCHESGHRPNEYCDNIDSIYVTKAGLNTEVCPYHQLIHLDPEEKFRVNNDCESVYNMVHKPWFVLPPVMEWYYKDNHPFYRRLPPLRDDCQDNSSAADIEFIYPRPFSRLMIPTGLDGKPGRVVFEIAHRKPSTKVYWHLDEIYLGETQHIHQMSCHPEKGKHVLRVVDENGVEEELVFEVKGDG